MNEHKLKDILYEWLDNIVGDETIKVIFDNINNLEEKDFSSVIEIVNRYLGYELTKDGEFDGIAMAVEELFEVKNNERN